MPERSPLLTESTPRTESGALPTLSSYTAATEGQPCASCSAPLAADQRYCLECGARRAHAPSQLVDPLRSQRADPLTTPPTFAAHAAPPAGYPPASLARQSTIVAGVGVLLLAMGVGVLIGRAGTVHGKSPAPQVISVGAAATAPAVAPAADGAAAFTDDWPAGTSGWTVQLQALPSAGAQPGAVVAAKAAASAKGASGVGALRSDDFSGLPSGQFIVYSGVDKSKHQAEQALAGLKRSFPGATVIKVSSAGASQAPGSAGAGGSGGSHPPPSSQSHPAGPSVVQKLRSKNSTGQSYEQKSRNLPDVVSTG